MVSRKSAAQKYLRKYKVLHAPFCHGADFSDDRGQLMQELPLFAYRGFYTISEREAV